MRGRLRDQDPPAPDAPALTRLVRGIGLLAAEGASLGLFGWLMRVRETRAQPYALANEITPTGRWFVLGNMALGIGIAVLLGGLVLLARRRENGAALVERLGRRAAPIILVGWLPLLFDARLWPGHELTMLILIAFFGLALQALARVSLSTAPVLADILPRLGPTFATARRVRADLAASLATNRWLPWALLGLGMAGYAFHFSYHTLQTHYRVGTAAFDLGLESNVVWNAMHGARLFKASPLGGPDAVYTGLHQPYFAYLLAPLYALAPRPQTLLVLQSCMIALAAVPLFLLARRRLGAGLALVLALSYLLYPPAHGSNLYDFHYQPLSVFFLLFILYFLEERRDILAGFCIVIAFSLREDISSLVAVLGLYLVLTGIRPRAGVVVMLVGGLFFGVLKFLIMPRYLGGVNAYVDQYKNLLGQGDLGFAGVLKTVFANPFFTLNTLVERDKLIYLLQIFTPLAFLPWRRPIGMLCCVPGFFFTLLATQYPPLIQISFQYTAYWTPFLFIATIAAFDRLRERERDGLVPPTTHRAWAVALVGAMLVGSFQFGAILNKSNTRGGFGPYRFGLTADDIQRHNNAHALIAQVPPMAKIVGSELVVPQVSSRPDAYTLRTGVFDAEYLLFEVPCGGEERNRAVEALSNNSFGVVDVKGEFVLAKRGAPTTRNKEILARL
jgi:uncharacterized membrane protein